MIKRIITIFLLLVCFLLLPKISLSQGNPSYEVSIVKAVTNTKILPTTYPITSIGNEINITAAPGEYEPASFVVHALQNVTGMQASPTNLISGANTIPASAVDIRYVKVWYQAGEGIEENNKRILKPELLLKDPDLVRVNYGSQKNYLRNPDQSYTDISDPNANVSNIEPRDSATLQPVNINANKNQQYWITVLVPENTPAGIYQGTINLAASNAPGVNIPFNVTVPSFVLEKSSLTYSIYYGANLIYYSWDQDKAGDMTYAWRTPERYLAEMKDLKDHGIEYPQLGERNDTVAVEELELREQAGLPMSGPLFTIGIDITGQQLPTSEADLNVLKDKVRSRIALASPFGFSDIYFYGKDEAHDPELTQERPAFQAIREAGGKTYVSTCDYCSLSDGWGEPTQYEAFRIIGDLLDVAVEAFVPVSSISQNYHSIGHKVFNYGNPQCGVEEPETYRRNYGLTLWKAGYDGAMDCCYAMNYGPTMWNDFDTRLLTDENYRDHVMSYPTMNGVIDTIQMEGFREGVDDTRYLATLQKAIAASTRTALKNEAQNWLDSLDASGDLDAKRSMMIDYTNRLTAQYFSADINKDDSINLADFSILKTDFLKLTANLSNPRSDINADGQCTVKDLGILMSGWR